MAYIHAISAGHFEWVLYAVTLLAGALSDGPLAVLLRRGLAGEVSAEGASGRSG